MCNYSCVGYQEEDVIEQTLMLSLDHSAKLNYCLMKPRNQLCMGNAQGQILSRPI